jgi:hypothetical protein
MACGKALKVKLVGGVHGIDVLPHLPLLAN